jgi:hypothetical protein
VVWRDVERFGVGRMGVRVAHFVAGPRRGGEVEGARRGRRAITEGDVACSPKQLRWRRGVTLAQARMPVLVKGVKRNATCYDFGFVARICCATRTLAGESKRRTLEDTAGKLHGAALGFARNRAQERRMICGE